MPASLDLDFGRIRGGNPAGRRASFEELVCQLGHRDQPSGAAEFRRVEGAGGDGGVEAYWLLPNGSEAGYQAKYFLRTADIDWGQIDKSVEQAIGTHPGLTRYVIALPCDLTDRAGPQGRGRRGWETWDVHKSQWEHQATKLGLCIAFEPWTKHELHNRLIESVNAGLVRYWFDTLRFDHAWFQRRFVEAQADLADRFHPEDHVEVQAAHAIGGLVRSRMFHRRFEDALLAFASFTGVSASIAMHRINPMPPAPLVDNIADCCSSLAAIGKVLSTSPSSPWPVPDVKETAACLRGVLRQLDDWFASETYGLDGQKNKAMSGDDERRRWYRAREVGWAIREAIGTLDDVLGSNAFKADATRFLIAIGRAGTGKSQLVADWVKRRIDDNKPALLLLGQHFGDGDPWVQIVDRLDLAGCSRDEFLGALDAAAEHAQVRCVIAVDAVNEGLGARLWRSRINSFATAVHRFPNLSLLLTCRSEYDGIVLPEIATEVAARVTVHGFRTRRERERAAQVYMDRRGITRPTAPWTSPVLTNPLLLRTCCLGLQKQGRTEFPRDLNGVSRVLDFYVQSLAVGLDGTNRDPTELMRPASVALRGLAAGMAAGARDHLPHTEAARLVGEGFVALGSPRNAPTWLDAFLRAGALRLDPDTSRLDEENALGCEDVVRFGFQRFGDHLIAQTLVAQVADASFLAEAFRTGGALSGLLTRDGWMAGAPGILAALAIVVPERLGAELVDILPGGTKRWWSRRSIQQDFQASLPARTAAAFTDRTRLLWKRLHHSGDDGPPQVVVLAQVATLLDHPLNADGLDAILRRLPLHDRDALWSDSLREIRFRAEQDDEDEAPHPLHALINWGWCAPKERVGDDVLRLTATFLCWCLATPNCRVRDRATRALASVLLERPVLFPDLLARFAAIDDPYVLERLLATAYGVACASVTRPEILAGLASATYRHVFADGRPPVQLLTRDYARGIIEAAEAHSGLLPEIDLGRVRPPYVSEWPLELPSDAELERIAAEAGDDAILRSARSWGDFGRYEIEPLVKGFTAVPLTDAAPLSPEEKLQQFETDVVAPGSAQRHSLFESLIEYNERIPFLFRVILTDGTVAVEPDSKEVEWLATAISQRDEALTAFLADLTSPEIERFDELARPKLLPDTVPPTAKNVPSFDVAAAQRWVTARAYALKWTKARFPKDSDHALLGRGRERPVVERIGKKYQWIALHELLARLADHCWIRRHWSDAAMQYDNPCQVGFVRDIDPTLFGQASTLTASDRDQPEERRWLEGLVTAVAAVDEDAAAWPFRSNTLFRDPGPILFTDRSGAEWLVLDGYAEVTDRLPASDYPMQLPRSQVWFRVNAVIVAEADEEAAWQLLLLRRTASGEPWQPSSMTDGPFLLESGWRSTCYVPEIEVSRGDDLPGGMQWHRAVVRYAWEKHLDSSLADGVRTMLPMPWLRRAMELRTIPSRPGHFEAAGVGVAFYNREAEAGGYSPTLVRQETFLAALARERLRCIWVVAGERSAWPDGSHTDVRWRSIGQLYRMQGSVLARSEVWHEDANQPGESSAPCP